MTDVVLFDEQGIRAQKLTMHPGSGGLFLRWSEPVDFATVLGWGFLPERFWRPSYYAVRMGRGWRVFPLDEGEVDFVSIRRVSNWWRPTNPTHRRFPNIASVEVYLRTICAHG